MPVSSVCKRCCCAALEELEPKPPITDKFKHLAPPRGDESLLDVCACIITDARAGLHGIDPDELASMCEMCDEHGRDMKQFQQFQQFQQFEEKKPGTVPSALPASSIASLALYTVDICLGESLYSACNAALRSANRSKCDPFVPFIWQLMHAMAKCERYDGGHVYRGVQGDLRAMYTIDREVTWCQFSSCTCAIHRALGFEARGLSSFADSVPSNAFLEQSEQFLGSSGTRTLFSIELTTGRARIITKFSLVPSEAEVLLPPNSRFKVVSQLDAGSGLIVIRLKELPSNDPIINFDAMIVRKAEKYENSKAALRPMVGPEQVQAALAFVTAGGQLSKYVRTKFVGAEWHEPRPKAVNMNGAQIVWGNRAFRVENAKCGGSMLLKANNPSADTDCNFHCTLSGVKFGWLDFQAPSKEIAEKWVLGILACVGRLPS